MINTACLVVPGVAASLAVRRQQPITGQARISYPSIDRDACKKFVERYITELRAEGFEVCIEDDAMNDQILVRVRKGSVMYCESVSCLDFEQSVCMDYILRKLVGNVENAFNELERKGL